MNPPQQQSRPGSAGPPQGGGGMAAAPAINPLKIVIKYKYLLIAAGFVGIIVGVGAHFLLAYMAPRFTSDVIFQCAPVQGNVEEISVANVDQEEMERFMGTQVSRMTSDLVLRKVVTDPRLLQEAPNWSKPYLKGGQVDIVEALDDLKESVGASAVPRTFLIRLNASAGNPSDAAGLAGMVKDAYRSTLVTGFNRDIVSRRSSLQDSIDSTSTRIDELAARKSRLVREERINSINSAQSATAQQLGLVNGELLEIQKQLEAMRVMRAEDQAQLDRETGIEYDSTLRERVEQNQLILTFKQELKSLETRLMSLKADGYQPAHRMYKQVVNQIESHERKIEKAREELLREAFESRLSGTIRTINQIEAQEADLLTQKEELEEELTELTRISEEIQDIDRQIEAMIARRSQQESALSELQSSAALESSQRVSVAESESVPDSMSFPKLIMMVPAGVVFVLGATGGIVFLIETLDQRVKSASDVRALPRVRSLGSVMDASEDPTKPEDIGSACATAPGSVLAEHVRQLRTTIAKDMQRDGLKSLVVTSAMPGSGASTIIANMAHASVNAGQRVLVLDANVRRPSMHDMFGVELGKGLGEIVTGEAQTAECVRTIDGGPDLITVGGRSKCRPEHLSGRRMSDLVDELGSSYDLVLIDVSPAVVAGDAAVLANIADSSILVARALSEKKGQVARVARELGECRGRFMGVVVNAVQSAAGGYMGKNIRTAFAYQSAESSGSGPDPKPRNAA